MNNNSSKRKTFKNNKQEPTLRNTYGEMIIKKDTILYHTSDKPFIRSDTKPMLFLTFHPSDFVKNCKGYVTQIKITRDVNLLFMIDKISENMRIYSSLGTLLGNSSKNLAKVFDKDLKCYTTYLKKESFDGWFTSVEGGTATRYIYF